MAKKLQGAAAASADIFDTIARGATEETQNTEDTLAIEATEDTKTIKYYRFNLKMPIELKEYLQAAAYRESSPQKIVTITEYICNLIRADMEKNGGQ